MENGKIKSIRNVFKLEKGNKQKKTTTTTTTKDDIIKNIRNLFKLGEETEPIKDEIINDIRNLFEQEKDYYKPIRVGNFYRNNYNEYENNGDRDKKSIN